MSNLRYIYPEFLQQYHINYYVKYIHTSTLSNIIIDHIDNKYGDCSICLDSLIKSTEIHKNIVLIKKCNHMFHKKCIFEWFKNSLNCPNCRIKII